MSFRVKQISNRDDFSSIPPQQPLQKGNLLLTKNPLRRTIILSHLFRKIGVFIFIFLFFGYLGWQFYDFFRPPRLEIFSPKDNLVTHVPLLTIEGKTEKESQLFINNVNVLLSHDGAFKEDLGLQKGVNIIKIEAVKKNGKKNVMFKKVLLE